MTLLRSLLRSSNESLRRFRGAARREFLRDPDVILFERIAEPAHEIAGRR